MTTNRTVRPADGAEWLRRWDEQQSGYLADREERFGVILDVVADVTGTDRPTVLDLCCGPGSLAVRLLARFPAATVVGLDNDPVLLLLGRRANGTVDGRLTWVEADLRQPAWTESVGDLGPFDAVVSTTALHWLDRPALGTAYAGAAALLAPGGVLVNGDHLYEPERPRLSALQMALRGDADDGRADGHDADGLADKGHEEWEPWWEALRQAADGDPELAAAFAQRSARDAEHPDTTEAPPLREHLAALSDAGLTDAGIVWQRGDDRVLVAMR